MSSIARKNLMALTGLFLCLFLVIHLLGNLQLFLPLPQGQLSFNKYARFLSELPVIKIAAYGTYACIVAHALLAGRLTRSNRESAGEAYAQRDPGATSPWYTRFMGVLGTVLLLFIIVHMWDFWYPFKFGNSVHLDAGGNKDLYSLVADAFRHWWYVAFYVVSMVALAFHLYQGFYNGFRSLGLHHPVYSRWANGFSKAFAILISLGFAAMPLYLYLTQTSAE